MDPDDRPILQVGNALRSSAGRAYAGSRLGLANLGLLRFGRRPLLLLIGVQLAGWFSFGDIPIGRGFDGCGKPPRVFALLAHPAFAPTLLAHSGHGCIDHFQGRRQRNDSPACGIEILEEKSRQSNSVLLGNLVIELIEVGTEAIFHHPEDAIGRHGLALHIEVGFQYSYFS